MTYEPAMHGETDMTGVVIGLYRVLGKTGTKKFPSGATQIIWAAECLSCGSVKESQKQHVMNSKYGCKECKGTNMSGKESCHWKGGEVVPGVFLTKAKLAAKRRSRDIAFDVSLEYLEKLWLSQNSQCAYTGWPINFGKSGVEQTASLDRIDSSIGYIEGNVQFVHKDVNIMKHELSDSRFREICRAITERDFSVI